MNGNIVLLAVLAILVASFLYAFWPRSTWPRHKCIYMYRDYNGQPLLTENRRNERRNTTTNPRNAS
jgi:hypothetical protein